jgi:hypothetical protein
MQATRPLSAVYLVIQHLQRIWCTPCTCKGRWQHLKPQKVGVAALLACYRMQWLQEDCRKETSHNRSATQGGPLYAGKSKLSD